jgi:hypothetical protein
MTKHTITGIEHKILSSPWLRPCRWEHSSALRRFLARFIPLKPNRFVPAQAFQLADGSIIVDQKTYERLKNGG